MKHLQFITGLPKFPFLLDAAAAFVSLSQVALVVRRPAAFCATASCCCSHLLASRICSMLAALSTSLQRADTSMRMGALSYVRILEPLRPSAVSLIALGQFYCWPSIDLSRSPTKVAMSAALPGKVGAD